MSDSDRPRSPFAGMANLAERKPVRVLSRDEIEQMLALHRLYLETEYHKGHRANFASADLTGRDFSGLDLRGVKMDRVVLRAPISPELICGVAIRRDRTAGVLRPCGSVPGARLSGANLVSASFENICLARTEMEFALMADAVLRGAFLGEA